MEERQIQTKKILERMKIEQSNTIEGIWIHNTLHSEGQYDTKMYYNSNISTNLYDMVMLDKGMSGILWNLQYSIRPCSRRGTDIKRAF